jgi:ATP-dependent helicase HrpA
MRLYNLSFAAELKQLGRTWAFPDAFASRVFFMGGIKSASEALYDYILRMIFGLDAAQHPDRRLFLQNIERLRGRLGAAGSEVREPVLLAVEQRHDTVGVIDRFIRMAGANRAVTERLGAVRKEVEKIIPPDFLSVFPQRRVRLLVRYLKGLCIRAERAYVYPEKDRAKEAGVLVYVDRLEEIGNRVFSRPTQEGIDFVEDVAQMIEEFKISLFAPEMKTLFPVSDKRLEAKLGGFRP